MCGACGAEIPAGGRFCGACGAAVAADAAASPDAIGAVHRGAPAAERRLVTVLFADAQGSTALTEAFGDEEAYRLMQACVTHMTEAVECHGGTVTQFRGDGIMALFGAPVALEDSALRAVSAALDMQVALGALREEAVTRHGPACHFRIGVHTGPVVVGRVADSVVMDYTAIGDTANVAARMEQAATADSVYLSEPTWRAVRDFIDCEPVGELEVKGKSRPVPAYSATGRTEVRTRLDAARSHGLSEFVGRDRELDMLEGFVSELAEGKGRVVLVTGDAGIGKSRLLYELRNRLPDGVRWIEGQCSAMDHRTPWLPIIDLLRRSFAIDEDDDATTIARKVDDGSSRWSAEARLALPYLKWLLHAADEDVEGVEVLDPRERRAGVYEALRVAVVDAATRGPMVVAIEDLHWADEASEGALAALADAVGDEPVLLLVTYRPGYADRLGDRPWYTRIALDQLTDAGSARLAAAALDVAVLSSDLERLIIERAEGNPLFVEEVTASLLETGAIRRLDGRYELAVDRSVLDIPGTLQEVILARIDRLEHDAREALQLAAVIGREFTKRVLDRIADLPDGLDVHLTQLQSLELIRQKSYFPELAFLFKHALTHDVAYSTLLTERRQALHRLVAQSIEELYADRLVEHYEVLARHWREAGDDHKALDYLERAGDKATAGFATTAALEFYDRAAQIAERLGDERLLTLIARQGEAYVTTGALVDAEATFGRMAELARRSNDLEAETMGLGMQGFVQLALHQFDSAEAIARSALALPRTEPGDGQVMAAVTLRCLYMVLNRRDEVVQLEADVADLVGDPIPDPLDRTRLMWFGYVKAEANWRARWDQIGSVMARLQPQHGLLDRLLVMWGTGLGLGGRGDYDDALDMLHDALAMAERADEVMVRARALNTIGWILADLGDLDGAIEWNRRCLEFIAPIGIPNSELESNARLNLADAYLALGRLDEAEEHIDFVEAIVRNPTDPDRWMLWRYSQHLFHVAGELRLARGDPEGALAYAEECIDLAEDTDSPKNVVKGRRLRGQALAADGRSDDALAELEAAVAVARRIANPPQLWRTIAALASLHHDRGDEANGRRHTKEALEVIQRVADGLRREELRRSLLDCSEVTAIREMC